MSDNFEPECQDRDPLRSTIRSVVQKDMAGMGAEVNFFFPMDYDEIDVILRIDGVPMAVVGVTGIQLHNCRKDRVAMINLCQETVDELRKRYPHG